MKSFLMVIVFTLVFILMPIFVFADQYSIDDTAGKAGLTGYGGGDVSTIVGNVIGAALAMVAVLFFGLMIYAGINWMADRGNEERSKKALHTITASVIGLVIILASYGITNFVFKSGGAFQASAPATNPRGATNQNGITITDEDLSEPLAGVCCMFSDNSQEQTSTGFNNAQWVEKGSSGDSVLYLCGQLCINTGGLWNNCTPVQDITQARCSIGSNSGYPDFGI